MKILFAERAVVEPEKVRDYLLSATHPVQSGVLLDARVHRRELARIVAGFAPDPLQGDAVQGKFSRFGNKYEVPAILTGPSGQSAAVLTVWIVRHGEEIPRLVTAMPGEKP